MLCGVVHLTLYFPHVMTYYRASLPGKGLVQRLVDIVQDGQLNCE